jgi:PTS system cellobiose-specific IIB component
MTKDGKFRILLICVNAMSSGVMVEKMKKVAASKGVDVEIDAVAGWGFKEVDLSKIDVILLSPQVRHYKKDVENFAAKFNVPVCTIDFTTYGLVNGEKCLELALSSLKKE